MSSQGASHEAGVGLPGYLGGAVEPAIVIEWARRADQAGFHGVAVHDRPNHDAWDPLATLAAAATVTERVRLATTAVLLPAYDETLLARQAAVVDRVSGGRLDLGVGLGARADDYQALGRPFGGRGRRLRRRGRPPRRHAGRRRPARRGERRAGHAPPGSERGALVAGSVEVLRRETATRSRLTAHLASIILC